MTQIVLQIKSNNNKTLNKFLTYLEISLKKIFTIEKMNFHVTKSKMIFSILKSAHVNKIAQEHFEINRYNTQITFTGFENEKLSEFLKKINSSLFPEIQFRYKLSCYSTNYQLKFVKKVSEVNDFLNFYSRCGSQIVFNYEKHIGQYCIKKTFFSILFKCVNGMNEYNNIYRNFVITNIHIANYNDDTLIKINPEEFLPLSPYKIRANKMSYFFNNLGEDTLIEDVSNVLDFSGISPF